MALVHTNSSLNNPYFTTGLAHEVAESITSNTAITNCTIPGSNQIADICGAMTGSGVVQAGGAFAGAGYWSQVDNTCVIPNAWPSLWELSGGTWYEEDYGITIRQVYDGMNGAPLVMDTSDTLYLFYAGYYGYGWLNMGAGGAMHAMLDNGKFARLELGSATVSLYDNHNTFSWITLPSPAPVITGIYGGGSIYATDAAGLAATDAAGNLYIWNGTSWVNEGIAVDEYVPSSAGAVALALNKQSISQLGSSGWTTIGGAAVEIYGSTSTDVIVKRTNTCSGGTCANNAYALVSGTWYNQGAPADFYAGLDFHSQMWRVTSDRSALQVATEASSNNWTWASSGTPVPPGQSGIGRLVGTTPYYTPMVIGCAKNSGTCVTY
jgi:hypothetical protein